jgi:hypothetical protein
MYSSHVFEVCTINCCWYNVVVLRSRVECKVVACGEMRRSGDDELRVFRAGISAYTCKC